jgi:hypothetical protein
MYIFQYPPMRRVAFVAGSAAKGERAPSTALFTFVFTGGAFMNTRSFSCRILSNAILLCALALPWAPGAGLCAQEAPLHEQINEFIDELKESFEKELAASVVKSTRLSRTDRYFVSVLRRHQPFYSLIRTNSKGVIINEVIRGQSPERNLRNISNQRWFSQIERTHESYYGFLKEDNGRYYLFWSRPLLSQSRSGSTRFVGAAAAKIDLWDAFHQFSDRTTLPFVIRIGGMTLYSHKWHDTDEGVDEDLEVPGLDRISVTYVPPPPAAHQTDTAVAAMPDGQPPAETAAPKAASGGLQKLDPRIIIVGSIILLIVLAIAFVRIMLWARHRSLMKKIERDDIL